MQTDYAAARSTQLFPPKRQCPFFQRIVDRRLAKHCGHSHRREAGRQHRQEQPGVVSHLRDEDDAGERRPHDGGEEGRHSDHRERGRIGGGSELTLPGFLSQAS